MAAAKRVLQGRHVAGSEFMHHAASTFTVSTKNESYNYIYYTLSGSLQSKLSPPYFFLTTPRDIHIECSKQIKSTFYFFVLVFWVVLKLPLKAKVGLFMSSWAKITN